MTQLILASASPRRRELLARCGIPFTVVTAEVAELTKSDDPASLPRLNAERKAAAVAALYPEALTLGADTVILCRGEIIGKPRDLTDAAAILRRLSGRTHEVLTGIAFRCPARGIESSFTATTAVRFRKLDEAAIARYLAAVPVLDKAGAYALQEHGDWLIESVEGEPENVIGLPVRQVAAGLAALGMTPGGEFSETGLTNPADDV